MNKAQSILGRHARNDKLVLGVSLTLGTTGIVIMGAPFGHLVAGLALAFSAIGICFWVACRS